MQLAKSLFASKVFWVAVIQALIAIVVVFQGTYPELGGLLVLKSALDIGLRVFTTQPVSV